MGKMGHEPAWAEAGQDFTFPLVLSQGYVLKGWVDLTTNKPHVMKKSIKYLEQGTQDTKDVLGLMGKVSRRK